MTFGHPFQDPSSTGLTTDLLNQVQIVFADERVDNVELYYMEVDSTNGTKLIEDERITISQRYSISPSIAVNSSDSVHMAWGDNRSGNMEIWYTVIDSSGVQIGPYVKLNTNMVILLNL